MSDADTTKNLPDVPDTEPTMLTVMESLNGLDERLTNMQAAADRRHAETNANFQKLGDKMDILNRRVLESEANQVDLRRRIEELETQAS